MFGSKCGPNRFKKKKKSTKYLWKEEKKMRENRGENKRLEMQKKKESE